MTSFLKYLSNFVFTVIFGTGLIFFISGIQTANHSTDNIINNPSLSSLNKSMGAFSTGFSDAASIQKNSSLSEQAVAPTGAIMLFSMLTSLGRFISLPITFTYSLFSAVSTMLGVPSVILGLISALILLTGIFLWYKNIKQG